MKELWRITAVFGLYFVFSCSPCTAKDLYVTQNVSGADTGTNCINAHSVAWFNSSANWAGGATQISPGDKVHLCGTFIGTNGNTLLTFQGSGTLGAPITLLFEPGAVLTAGYWGGNGAIACTRQRYITIHCGSDGRVQATSNGTGLANQQDSEGVVLTSCNNGEL